jgi:hypothetical protein
VEPNSRVEERDRRTQKRGTIAAPLLQRAHPVAQRRHLHRIQQHQPCPTARKSAVNRHTTTLRILILSLFGFVGSVSVARFTPGADDVEPEKS